jgi:hypothetical protein
VYIDRSAIAKPLPPIVGLVDKNISIVPTKSVVHTQSHHVYFVPCVISTILPINKKKIILLSVWRNQP